MPKFTCVFVKEDKETVYGDARSPAETKSIDADTPSDAASIYQQSANPWKGIGPCIRVRDDQCGEVHFFNVASEVKKHAEAKQAAKSSLSSTDILLKELIKEQKQTNEWLKKVRWSLLVIHIIMVLWFVFGWVIKPI